MTFEDIENLPVKDVLGARVIYRDNFTGRKRTITINAISKTVCSATRKDHTIVRLRWKEIISMETKNVLS